MKTLFLVSLALIASAGVAVAADAEPVVYPGPFEPPPAFPAARATLEPVVRPGILAPPPAYPHVKAYDWTGFYVGINGGGAFDSLYWNSVPDLATGTARTTSGLVGGTAGYNLQTGDPFVLGTEADMDWSSFKTTVPPASCAPGCEFKIDWLATLRLRFGYAFDVSFGSIMPYATGGVVFDHEITDIVGSPFGSQTFFDFGWTAGAGVEVALLDALRVKVEYLHFHMYGDSCNVPCGGGPISFKPDSDIVRVGLNYRLWK